MIGAGEPSRTALLAAAQRAAHQSLDGARIFTDPLALAILGAEGERLIAEIEQRPSSTRLRLFLAMRSKVAESRLAEAVEFRGVRQAVVLGAGLDTFAYRNPFADRLRVFEVDHPATQAWKRQRLREAGIPIPPGANYVAVDFERDDLTERLRASGLAAEQRTFFIWLGVVPYLTEPAILGTLNALGGSPAGAELVFDYANPPDLLGEDSRAAHVDLAGRVAGIGEAFVTYFTTETLHPALRKAGFTLLDDRGPRALFGKKVEGNEDPGGHVIYAATPFDHRGC